MRNRNFLLICLLVFALAAPAVRADPSPAAGSFAEEDSRDQDKKDKKDKKWKDDDRDHRGSQGIPPGHLPPPGECRVWFDDLPPGHQPPPTDCDTARREAARSGGRVIYGDDRGDDRWDDHDHWDDDDRWDDHRDDDDRWDDHDRWGHEDEWDERWFRRFESLDRNDDGYLSRSEWRSDDRLFDRLDLNDDGRLSRNEIRDAQSRYGDRRGDRRASRLEDRFRDSDDNRDGRLSLNEWWGSDRAFDRLDRNNDGLLSWAEVVRDRRSSR